MYVTLVEESAPNALGSLECGQVAQYDKNAALLGAMAG
jgi:hypothetical protein